MAFLERKKKMYTKNSERSKQNSPIMDDRKSVMRGPKETRKTSNCIFD